MAGDAADSEVLLRRAGSGDEAAVRSLLERHLPALRFYVNVRMGPDVRKHETEADVVQSVCLEVLANPGSFEYRGEAAFRHWLFTAALRKLVEKGRYYAAEKRNHERALPLPSDSSPGLVQSIIGNVATPSRIASARETLARLQDALRSMPEESREIILLSRLMGLTHAEIANRLGKTEAAVRTALYRALAKLAPLLAD